MYGIYANIWGMLMGSMLPYIAYMDPMGHESLVTEMWFCLFGMLLALSRPVSAVCPYHPGLDPEAPVLMINGVGTSKGTDWALDSP